MITNSILRTIKNKDSLYKQLKSTSQDTEEFTTIKNNSNVYSKILNKNIAQLKQEYYHKQFEFIKNDAKKAWETINLFFI